ncbi:hypothetical protein CcaverHIS641_0704010 [Cutaneotrichosporon cavernicola]|nr:hypothetical protein CcaverHIS641_0704010 [Cutaneotrichosporon cavernicola]
MAVVILASGVELHARISTPGNPTANKIDPSLPSIVFCHPTWLDSFFFYPQIEDPLFTDGYNLVAFDMRGHGLTLGGSRPERYDAWSVADDIVAGMDGLGIRAAHVVGVAFGAVVAANLASAHADRVKTLTLISLPPNVDNEDTAMGYAECREALVAATLAGDADTMDAITQATFAYDAGALAPAIREVRDEYMAAARERLEASPEEAADAAFYVWEPVTTRQPQTTDEMAQISAPVLILQAGTTEEPAFTEDAQLWAFRFNSLHRTARAQVHMIDNVGHFMTLTSPNVVNPLVAKFIGTPASARLPPLPRVGARIRGPSEPRRPSTPRSATFGGFDMSIPFTRGPTVGEAMDRVNVYVDVVTEVVGTTMPRRKAPKGPGTDKPKLAKKRAKVTPTVALPTVAAQPQTQPQPVAGPSIIPWKQQLSNLVANLPPLPPAATPSTWTPETMAASLEAYTGWATSIRQWHRELESTLLEPNLDGLLEMISTPFAPPLTLAEAETNLPPNTLHAYLVNEVTPNYRRFRALSTPSLSEHVALESLGMALDDMLAQHVLPHIAPGHSSDVATG